MLERNWEKFDLSPDQGEKKVKNTRTGYGRFLKKSVPSGSGREVLPVLNLKNGANDVVRPRSPQYFLSDQIAAIIWKQSIATIAGTIFSSDRSDHMETELNKVIN